MLHSLLLIHQIVLGVLCRLRDQTERRCSARNVRSCVMSARRHLLKVLAPSVMRECTAVMFVLRST